MKDKKSLNKLLYGIILICSSIVFIYAIGVGIIVGAGRAVFWTLNGAVSGTIFLFVIFTLAAIIVRMIMVTVPTLKNSNNKMFSISALVMDILALIGIVFLVCAFIMGNIEPTEEASYGVPVMLCILLGAPFISIGELVAYKLEKSVL